MQQGFKCFITKVTQKCTPSICKLCFSCTIPITHTLMKRSLGTALLTLAFLHCSVTSWITIMHLSVRGADFALLGDCHQPIIRKVKLNLYRPFPLFTHRSKTLATSAIYFAKIKSKTLKQMIHLQGTRTYYAWHGGMIYKCKCFMLKRKRKKTCRESN